MLALCLSAVTAFAPTHVLPRRVTMRPTLTSISMVDSDLQSKLDDIEILKAKLAELDAAKSAAAAPVVPPPVVETPPPPAFEAPPPAFEPPALDTISQAAPSGGDSGGGMMDMLPFSAPEMPSLPGGIELPSLPSLPSFGIPSFGSPDPAAVQQAAESMSAMDGGGSGFSAASYYTTLGLYVVSFPGVYSLVKRSVKAKVVRKTYEIAGPAAPGGRPTREMAGDIVAFFQANNYKITDAAETIVFEGVQAPLVGRAAFLTFCVFIAFISLALVLTIFEQQAFGGGLGNIWYLSALASPAAGKYYLDNAERTDQVTVKIVTEDDEMSSDIVVQGDEEEVTRFQKTLDLREKGMVYVKGILER